MPNYDVFAVGKTDQTQKQKTKRKQKMTTETTETTETRGPGRPASLSEKVVERAAKFYMNGWSVARIAAASWCDCEPATLRYHLARHPEVEMRGKGRQGMTDEQKALALELHNQGLKLSQIRNHKGLKVRERYTQLDENGEKVQVDRVKLFSLPTLSKAIRERGGDLRRGRPPVECEA